jgi:hypothetical protein
MTRFMFALLATLSILIGSLIAGLLNTEKTFFRRLIKVIFIFGILLNISVYLLRERSFIDPFPVAFGKITEEEYLERALQSHSVIEYVNKNLSSSEKVLFIGETRHFYCRKNYICTTVFNENPIVSIVKKSKDQGSILQGLRKTGITHILFNPEEHLRLKSQYPFYFNLSGEEDFLFNRFLKERVKVIYQKNNVYLLKLI